MEQWTFAAIAAIPLNTHICFGLLHNSYVRPQNSRKAAALVGVAQNRSPVILHPKMHRLLLVE